MRPKWPRIAETVLGDAEQAIEDARQRLAEVPAEIVVTNHVMGLYELAAIHLSSTPPNLTGASLAIDAVGCLVDGLGDRLGCGRADVARRPGEYPHGLRQRQVSRLPATGRRIVRSGQR